VIVCLGFFCWGFEYWLWREEGVERRGRNEFIDDLFKIDFE